MQKNDQLFAEERKQKIIEMIKSNNKIVVPELCSKFGVSATTIRKDLKELEEANLLMRTHGGAMSITKTSYEPLPSSKKTVMLNEKKAIARRAIEFIEDGDTVAMMTGTTVMELVKLLPQRKNLTVIVNDLGFAMWLEQNSDFRVYILSGLIRRNYHYVTSPMKCEMLSIFNIDKAFITCNGFTKENGATTPDLENALKIKEVLDRSFSIYLLCDSSKISSASFAQIAPPGKIDTLITDDGISKDDAAEITNETNLIIANT
jgi:DeoR family fructose operon transcriptional repressor